MTEGIEMTMDALTATDMVTTKEKRKSRALTVLKITVTVSLMAAILYRLDLPKLMRLFRSAAPVFILFAVAVTVISVILSAYKWQLLVKAQGYPVSLGKLISSYFVGLFFNNFMPTSIGGDVVRIIDLRRIVNNGAAAAASVVSERVLASVTLGLVVVMAAIFDPSAVSEYIMLIIAFALVCSAIFIAIIYADRLSIFVRRYKSPIALKIRDFTDSISASISNKWVLAKVMLYSLVFQVFVVLINLSIIKALGLAVDVHLVFLFIPIIFAITMLPVSLNGLGVREAAYAYFFGRAGLSAEEAIATSVYFFLIVTLVSLTGGVIFAFRK